MNIFLEINPIAEKQLDKCYVENDIPYKTQYHLFGGIVTFIKDMKNYIESFIFNFERQNMKKIFASVIDDCNSFIYDDVLMQPATFEKFYSEQLKQKLNELFTSNGIDININKISMDVSSNEVINELTRMMLHNWDYICTFVWFLHIDKFTIKLMTGLRPDRNGIVARFTLDRIRFIKI